MAGRALMIGFDIGGTNVAAALMDGEHSILLRRVRPFRRLGAEALCEELLSMARELCEAAGAELASIERLGACIPGSVDARRGFVIDAHNLSLHDVPFGELLSRAFLRRVTVLNDADAAALAESRLGALAGVQNSLLVTLGTGVGVGIILGGRLFHGGRGRGVEAGHMTLDMHGESCTCSRRGCAETLCSARFLSDRARALLGPDADAKTLIELAKRGDRGCVEAWQEYTDALSNALASFVNVLDPERIALGGGISGAGEFLLEPVRKGVEAGSFFREPTEIVLAKLGNDAGLVGACMYE